MVFKPGTRHINVKRAKARQLEKLKQQVGYQSGLVPKPTSARRSLGLAPQVGPQLEMMLAKWSPEIFFGGARGGGKSIALLLDFLQDCGKGYGGGWKGVIFRRSYPQLKQLIDDSHRIYGKIPGAVFLKKEREWIFPQGEKLEFRFLETFADVANYQGFAYQWIGWDELPNWPDLEPYDAMKASLRPTTASVPCRVRATGNPGGVGHTAVKQRFIDPAPEGFKVIEDDRGERMFIPSSVWDNKILLGNDPKYINRLEQSGPDHLVKAWLYGDWNIVLGSFYDCWSEKNVVASGSVPRHWFKFRAFDWGGHAPFCVHWWAVSDGVTAIQAFDGNYVLPAGAKVCYREWFGCDEKDYKKGLALDNEEIAAGILKRTHADEEIAFTVADNLPFQRRGGPTIAETFDKCGVPLIKGDTDRVSGCSATYLQIKGGESRVPMMYFMDCAKHAIRQMPLAQKDPKLVEVYLQGSDDDALDCIKLAAKVREWSPSAPVSLPTEAERLHNSIIERPTFKQILDTHFAKIKRARDPYGL